MSALTSRQLAYKEAVKDLPTEQMPSFSEWWQAIPEQRVMQGVYRGYAGDNSAMATEGPLFVANQKPMAEYFANKRAAQSGQEPHLEMFLADPFVGIDTYRLHPHTVKETSVVRKMDPRSLSGRTELYAKGGLARFKECSCGI
jgi:hypothetical protein